MSKYQIMPPLSEDQFEALKADISTAGIRVPIEVDENGEVIDGHHRRAIAMELGIECPETVIRGLAEFEKLDRAFVLNATRRHFDREQKRAVVVKSLMLHPRLADREHARRCGVSHPTVSGVRAALEAAGRLESFTSRVSGDGRERPAHNEPTRTAPETAAGAATPPADGEIPTAFQGSPATGAGASEADRPAPVVTPETTETANLGADDAGPSSSARPSIGSLGESLGDETGPEVPSSKAPAGPADERESQDRAGVSQPATPASDPVGAITVLDRIYAALDIEIVGPGLTDEQMDEIEASFERIKGVVSLLRLWQSRRA
jgi:hypothetical protein